MMASALMVLMNFLFPLGPLHPFPKLVGLVPLILSVVVVLAADRQFKRAGTTVKPFQPATALVTTGMYRFTRNPMYLSLALLLAAFALFMNHIGPALLVPVFVLVIQIRFIRSEERMLEEAFGERYRAYKERVRRWI